MKYEASARSSAKYGFESTPAAECQVLNMNMKKSRPPQTRYEI